MSTTQKSIRIPSYRLHRPSGLGRSLALWESRTRRERGRQPSRANLPPIRRSTGADPEPLALPPTRPARLAHTPCRLGDAPPERLDECQAVPKPMSMPSKRPRSSMLPIRESIEVRLDTLVPSIPQSRAVA